MRVWNEWADEYGDVVAVTLAFTIALAVAAALVLTLSAFTTRLEMPSTLPALSAPGVEDRRATLPTDLP